MTGNQENDLAERIAEAADIIDGLEIGMDTIEKVADLVPEAIKKDPVVQDIVSRLASKFQDKEPTLMDIAEIISSNEITNDLIETVKRFGSDATIAKKIEKDVFPLLFNEEKDK